MTWKPGAIAECVRGSAPSPPRRAIGPRPTAEKSGLFNSLPRQLEVGSIPADRESP